jgi:hypothetical protein
MLPAHIIEQIKKREEVRRQEQPVLELPLPMQMPQKRPEQEKSVEENRGVVVIDLF